jgi:hypothetical protein
MSSMEEWNDEITALKQELRTNKALVDAGTITDGAERVAIRNENSALLGRLTALEERRDRLHQQQQDGEL